MLIVSSARGKKVVTSYISSFFILERFNPRTGGNSMAKTATISATLFIGISILWKLCFIFECLKKRWQILFCFHKQIFQIQKNRMINRSIDERCRNTFLAETSSTTDTMDIVFNIFRHIEINNMLDGRKIETFGCNI